MRMPMPGSSDRWGFTLVELLVVIAIISVLVAILLPALRKARMAAQTAACLSNLRQIAMAATQYTQDNNGWLLDMCQLEDKSSWVLASANNSNVNNGLRNSLWMDVIYRYVAKNIGVLECPAQDQRRPTTLLWQLVTEPAPSPHDPNSPTVSSLIQPRREYYPGYMQNAQVHTWGPNQYTYPYTAPWPYNPNRNIGLKHSRFKNPSSKIWYADSGRRWISPSGPSVEKYSAVSSRGLEDADVNNSTGAQVSWRHGSEANPRGNVVFFDGHAVTQDPREVTSQKGYYAAMSPSDREKLIRYWDADGDGIYTTPLR